jgi:molybdopterin synthase sulfur carrier subunit
MMNAGRAGVKQDAVNLAFRHRHLVSMDMAKIHIPTPLRQYAGKQATVEVKSGTVADSLSDLLRQHPDLRRHLYTDEGKLRAFVNVYLNDEDVRYLQKEATPVNDGDTISIVPSIAGGKDDEIDDFRLPIVEVKPAAHMDCCLPACCRRM